MKPILTLEDLSEHYLYHHSYLAYLYRDEHLLSMECFGIILKDNYNQCYYLGYPIGISDGNHYARYSNHNHVSLNALCMALIENKWQVFRFDDHVAMFKIVYQALEFKKENKSIATLFNLPELPEAEATITKPVLRDITFNL